MDYSKLMDHALTDFGNALAAASKEYVLLHGKGSIAEELSVQAAVGKAMMMVGAINMGRSLLMNDEELDELLPMIGEFCTELSEKAKKGKLGKKLMEEFGDAE